MKKISLRIFIAISLAILLTANTVTSYAKAEGVSQNTEIIKNTEKKELTTKTVKTQKELTTALKSSTVDIIVIKPTKATTLIIPKGNYQKDLVVYQAYTTLVNNATFKNSNIYVTSKAQLDKAVKVNGIDTITVKTDKKTDLTSSKGNAKTALVVIAPNSNITNSATWKSVTINDMDNSVWTEKGKSNNIIVKGNANGIVINEKSTVKSLIVDQTKADTISINVDGTVKKVTLKAAADINLTGKNTTSFVKNITNETTKSIVINVNGKKVEVPSKTKTPTPTETPDVIETPNVTEIPNIIEIPKSTETPKPTETPVTAEQTETPSDTTAPTDKSEPTAPTTPTVPAHIHTYVGVITTSITCTEDGVKTYTCEADGNSYTEVIPAIGHTPSEWITTKAATFITTGTKVQKCTVCGETLAKEAIPVVAHTHDYVGVVTTPATETSTGVMTYTCSICGDIYTEVIPKIVSATPSEPAVYTVAIESTDGKTPSRVTGRDRLDLATEVFNKVNELRASLGLNELTWDNTMDDYTQLRAAEVTQKFSHERPNGERGYQMHDKIISENIAVGYETADEVMAGWTASFSHYSAMINPNYDTMAVGCFEEAILDGNGNPTGDYYTGWVQFFHDILEASVLPKLNEEIPMLEVEDKETVNGHKLVTVIIDLGNGQTKEVKGYYDYTMAQEVYQKLNDLRTSKGLNTLNLNNGMPYAADIRAAELTVKFDHWRPNGEYCYYIHDDMSSENVAMGYTTSADVMVGWINSPSHYNAMIKSDYKSVSISCFMYEALPGQYIGYWSMLFSKK